MRKKRLYKHGDRLMLVSKKPRGYFNIPDHIWDECMGKSGAVTETGYSSGNNENWYRLDGTPDGISPAFVWPESALAPVGDVDTLLKIARRMLA